MSSPKHVARKFLNWFENESMEFGEDVVYAPGTDFVERFRNTQTGALENAVDYVAQLANARMPTPQQASAVIEEARGLLRP